MVRPRLLVPLLVSFILLVAASCLLAQQAEPVDLSLAAATKVDPNIEPFGQLLMPDFERAAEKQDIPLPLLLTLGYFGSHFENRGDAPTIEGGYGVMALRGKNFFKADSLNEGASLAKMDAEKLKVNPSANIMAAAAVLDKYARELEIDRSQGLQAWLPVIVKYAGLDPEFSRMFAMEIFEKLAAGLDYVNCAGERFYFPPQDINGVELATLQPSSAKRMEPGFMTLQRPMDTRLASDYSIQTAQYPPAVWYGAASCNYTATSTSKDTIVIHTIEGSAAGAMSWMNNCNSDVSSHYVTSEAGGVWQMVDEWYRAWHAGCVNSRAIGIENEGYAGSASHPQLLYDTVGLLCRDICDSWGIIKEHRGCPPGICGHNDVNNCVCGGDHWDPGGGWDWNYMISVVQGNQWQNPPWLFGSNAQGWTAGNSASGIAYTGPDNWSGSIYFDQTGNDSFIYSPATNFGAAWAPHVLNVNLYPQSGTTAAHDMQVFWKTNAENSFTAEKSSPVVNYNAQNAWATVNLFIDNPKWWGQTVNQMRLDVDNTNHSTRFIINHIVLQQALWWHFDVAGDVMGWTAGNAQTAPWEYNDGWPGIMVSDQTGNDGFLYSPGIGGGGFPFNFLGGVNDWIHVRVFPQNGNTTAHDMGVYWTTAGDGTWSEAKSTHVTFNGKDQWVDVYLPVGLNGNWGTAQHITQLRLDFDQTNHGNRWIVDYVKSDHFGADTSAPSVPGGLAGSAASQTVVNLTWNVSTDNTTVNGYKIFRNGVQIGTSIAPSYTDSGCAAGTTYSYRVSSYDSVGNNSAQCTAINVSTPGGDTQAPSVPTNLAATAVSGTQINLTWTASTDNVGVTGYKVYRGGVQIGTSATASYNDTTCSSYTTYTYTVAAYDAANNTSAQSASAQATTWDATAPSVPTNLAGNAVSATQVNLTWTASTDNVGVTGYKVFRGGVQIGTSATASYNDTTCSSGQTYSYQVSAYDARSNESAKCTAINVTTPDGIAPSTPTNLTATSISQTQINLAWTASTDNVAVTGYKIFRGGQQIGTSATASYADTTCSSYTTYTYQVSAYDAAGNNSGLSNSAQATTQPRTDIVVDNPAATYVGAWSLGTSAPDKYGADYNYCTVAATETKSATFTPTIDVAGYYTVYVWYPQGANRSAMAPFTVVYDGGQQTVAVNQQTGGGQWVSLVTNKKFAAGTSGYIKLGNNTPESGLSVMADAVRVVLVSTDLTAPTVPANVAANGASATTVNVTWTASTDNVGVAGYRIFRNGVAVGTSATTSFTDSGLTQLTTYTYKVAAYDAMGNESAQSAGANGTTWDGTAPSVPGGLTATAATPTRINLAWSASTDNVGVTGYKIYRGGAYVATVTTLTWTDTGRSPGTAYSYQVSAIDARNNESAKSTAANATTPAFSDMVLDNGVCTFTGSWSTATSSADKYGADYRYGSTAVSESRTAIWRPTIAYAGNYNVYVWYPVGTNRATNSPFTTYWDGGSATTAVNQTVTGGQWVLIQSNRHFAAGTAGYVKLGNGTGSTGKIVVADAVRFQQVSGD